jgi:hypothetical protein
VVIVRDSEEEALAALPQSYRRVSREVTDHTSEIVRPITGTRQQVVERLRGHIDTGMDGMVLSCAAQDRNAEHVTLLGGLAREAYG